MRCPTLVLALARCAFGLRPLASIPLDIKKRQDAFGYGVQNPRVIPHSDGSGQVDQVVEVAFGANIDTDVELLKMGGSIAAYARDNATPKIPFWLMACKNIRLFSGERRLPERSQDICHARSKRCPSEGMAGIRNRGTHSSFRDRSGA